MKDAPRQSLWIRAGTAVTVTPVELSRTTRLPTVGLRSYSTGTVVEPGPLILVPRLARAARRDRATDVPARRAIASRRRSPRRTARRPAGARTRRACGAGPARRRLRRGRGGP